MIKFLASGLSKPTEGHLLILKQLARYTIGKEVAIILYEPELPVRGIPTFFPVFVDSDWAGDQLTRKSTSGSLALWCDMQVRSWCRGQSVLAQSSGEAELYSAVTGMCEAFFLVGILDFAGFEVKPVLKSDSSAAIGFAMRPGVGKTMKHIQIKYLLIQDAIQRGLIKIEKVDTKLNPADVLTKFLGVEPFQFHVGRSRTTLVPAKTLTAALAMMVAAAEGKEVVLYSPGVLTTRLSEQVFFIFSFGVVVVILLLAGIGTMVVLYHIWTAFNFHGGIVFCRRSERRVGVGSQTDMTPFVNEWLAEHSRMTNAQLTQVLGSLGIHVSGSMTKDIMVKMIVLQKMARNS